MNLDDIYLDFDLIEEMITVNCKNSQCRTTDNYHLIIDSITPNPSTSKINIFNEIAQEHLKVHK